MRVKYIKSLSNDEFPDLKDGKVYEAEQETEFFNGEDHFFVYDEDDLGEPTPYPIDIFEKIETKRIKCPCCGKFEFERFNDFDVCEVCGWENDGVQYDDPDYDGGANDLSLNQFREKWQSENKE
jgi:hypothetical protein